MSELLRKAEWLVSVPSPTAQEEALCDQLLSWAGQTFPQALVSRHRHGFRLQPAPTRPDRPTIALVGHIDTVPSAQKQRLGVFDGRLYGCGASDMKAGVAVMMEALEHWESWACNLVGLFYDREEGPYADNGLEALLKPTLDAEFAVVLEPTDNQIHAGCVGSLQARAHFHGQRAHSARPWQGKNAIYQAIPLLQKLSVHERRAVQCEGLEFYEVISATQAHSAGPSNAVPERFTLNLNSRFAPGKSGQQAILELQNLVNGEAELEVYDVAPSGAVRLSHPLLVRWIEQCQLEIQPKQAWTDVARLDAHGIAAFNFGPGAPAQAHQADEHVEIEAVHRCHQLLCRLLSQT